ASTVYRAVLGAVNGMAARVLVTVGRRFDPSGLDPVPSNVHPEAWVEQADVLRHADLVVCHGGSGTAFGALAAGVPVVIVPLFADQFENGLRIAGAGAGLCVETAHAADRSQGISEERDVPAIAGGIAEVLGEPRYRLGAQRIAREVASHQTVDEVLEALVLG
ncbi:MAG: glycosyltransferase, partial [Chloroflexota bacterium]